MSEAGEILLLADSKTHEELSSRLGAALHIQSDPYQALETMGRQSCRAVIVTAGRPEFQSFCRAARRVNAKSKIVALSSVAAEPQVRPLVGRELDDYFIYPPASEDIAALRRLLGLNGYKTMTPFAEVIESPSRPNGNGVGGILSVQEISELLDCATSTAALESCLSNLVAQKLSLKVYWINALLLEAREPLLLVAGEVPRALVSDDVRPLPAQSRQFLVAMGQILASLVASARRTEALHKLAITDHLTGAYNRRHFYHITDHILRQAKASQFRVTLLLYDIDNFKHYNETYGHAAGDEILRDTAMLMKRTSRSHDVVARIGGDEFAVLFWDVEAPRRPQSKPLEDFFMLAERFRLAVSSHSFASLGPEAQGVLTISGGLANFPADGDSCRQLLRAADHALRNIKRSGKNGIQLIGGEKKGNGKPANGQ